MCNFLEENKKLDQLLKKLSFVKFSMKILRPEKLIEVKKLVEMRNEIVKLKMIKKKIQREYRNE